MNDPLRSPKLRAWHLDRSAFVYVRQSTPQQVIDHQESTARQYALADRAVALGWAADRITTIDDDLGKSGQSIEGRPGFQRLLAEVALDHVGLILGLEMSRLARSNRDWHQLLELCARFRVLLADAEAIYDPADHNDRLLLGLHGMMSEAELHVLKERMYQGKLNKARRGALMGVPPIGYVRLASGEWAIDPDEQVQATVRLIFDQFDRETTLHGLLRYLVHHGVRIPVRSNSGPNRGELEWRRPNRTTLSNLLHHPSYAGAYRFGHRPIDPRRKQPGRPATGKQIRRPEECLVLIRDRLPAYITWDRFRANQERLEANRARQDRPGAPRQGPSLLAGLLRCGRCGRRMIVRYSGPKNRHAYTCTRGPTDYGEPLCQSLSGPVLDDLVAGRVLAAVEPAALEASLAAVAGVERERAELARHWQLRRERAAHEVDRAARQYQACEPENRLVGRELERRWEESLKAQRQLEDEYERWQRTAPGRLSPDDERAIRSPGRRPARGVAGGHDHAGREAADRPAPGRAGERHRRQGQRAGGRRVALGRRPGRVAHPVPTGEALRPPGRLPPAGREAAGLVLRGAERRGDRRSPQRGGLPAPEAGRSLQPGDGATAPVSPRADPSQAPRQPVGPGPGRVPPRRPGASAGDLAGHGAAVDPRRLGDVEPRRRGAPRDLGRRLRVGPAPRAPRPAADLGDQGSPGGIDQAKAPSGAIDCGGPAHSEPGHPTAHLEGIMAGRSSRRCSRPISCRTWRWS